MITIKTYNTSISTDYLYIGIVNNVRSLLAREILVNKGHIRLYILWTINSKSLATNKFCKVLILD